MNFLSEVLECKDKLIVQNIKEKTPRIVSQIAYLKCKVKKYMDGYVDLSKMKKRSNNLLEETSRLNDEMKELQQDVEYLSNKELHKSSEDLINSIADLNKNAFALKIVTQLVTIDDLLKRNKEMQREKKYLDANKCIHEVKDLLDEIADDEKLDIIQVIAVTMTIEHETILLETGKIWNETVKINKELTDAGLIKLSIQVDKSRLDDLQESIKTLCYENSSVFELQRLTNFLLNEVFTSIIAQNCTITTDITDVSSLLTITVDKTSEKLPYDQVFEHIQSVFEFLMFLNNFEVKDGVVLLSYVGEKISEQFCKILIEDCLVDTVPSTPEELLDYKYVVNEIENLQSLLLECQFFTGENQSILEYATNVDVLFANKMCQLYLDQARKILKKDLHIMVEVVFDSNLTKCSISKSTIEYLDLIRKILDQASTSSDMCAGRLVYTVEQIIGFYCNLIPEYHKKLLESIPQQVALFHNNCLYIAHELTTINKYFKDKNAGLAVKEESFTSQVQLLRTSGANALLVHMRTQIKQIQDILIDSELTKLGQSDKLDPNCEKSIRQCLRQLELLKTVWQKVLSYEIYNKTIGELLNSFVDYLIKIVVGVEDISSDCCTFLVDIYGIVKTRGPKLFTEPKEVNLYTKYWYKFNELIMLLNSNLTDIDDRWADGKGPLAVEFKPEEVKGLIRALFQNTDRRSAVLSKIN